MDVGAAVALGLLGAFAALILGCVLYKVAGNSKARVTIRFERRTYLSGEELQGTVTVLARKNLNADGLHLVLTNATNTHGNGVSYREEREVFGPRTLMAGQTAQGSFAFTIPSMDDLPNPFAALGESVQLKGIDVNLGAWQQQLLAASRWRIIATLNVEGVDAVRIQPVSIRLSKTKQPENFLNV